MVEREAHWNSFKFGQVSRYETSDDCQVYRDTKTLLKATVVLTNLQESKRQQAVD